MSYTIEVYWGRTKAERHFGIYALYVMFYPQLVAGPIERPQNLLHQFRREHHIDYDRIVHGLKLMAWGLFKKVVIADRIAEVVDLVYANPYSHSDLALLIATVLYAYQIYCDFSGYSDIAIGAAQVMGFTMMTNFRRPYYARSIQEFWSRWHISLSTWFKDYLYIPLGGNRVSPWRWRFNLFVVFLVSGLWHGANWTFLLWGALHGIYLVIGTVCGRPWRRTLQGIGFSENSRAVTLAEHLMTLAAVAYAWIFFRAASVGDAFHVVRRTTLGMPGIVHQALSISGLRACVNELLWPKAEWLILFLSIAILELYHYHDERGGALTKYCLLPTPLRWAGYYALIAVILLLGSFGAQQFIYFQF
jgi:alginate O-acetyltransferase complex protein AlgI